MTEHEAIEALGDHILDDQLEAFRALLPTVPREALSNHRFSDGSTLLVTAIHERRARFVEALLGAGADPDVVIEGGATALAIACYLGVEPAIVASLIAAGATTWRGTAGDGYGPITLAVESGDPEICRLLLDAGANIESNNNHSMTPLMMACMRRDERMVRFLLDRGADPRRGADGTDPLEMAGDDVAIRALLLAR